MAIVKLATLCIKTLKKVLDREFALGKGVGSLVDD